MPQCVIVVLSELAKILKDNGVYGSTHDFDRVIETDINKKINIYVESLLWIVVLDSWHHNIVQKCHCVEPYTVTFRHEIYRSVSTVFQFRSFAIIQIAQKIHISQINKSREFVNFDP